MVLPEHLKSRLSGPTEPSDGKRVLDAAFKVGAVASEKLMMEVLHVYVLYHRDEIYRVGVL